MKTFAEGDKVRLNAAGRSQSNYNHRLRFARSGGHVLVPPDCNGLLTMRCATEDMKINASWLELDPHIDENGPLQIGDWCTRVDGEHAGKPLRVTGADDRGSCAEVNVAATGDRLGWYGARHLRRIDPPAEAAQPEEQPCALCGGMPSDPYHEGRCDEWSSFRGGPGLDARISLVRTARRHEADALEQAEEARLKKRYGRHAPQPTDPDEVM